MKWSILPAVCIALAMLTPIPSANANPVVIKIFTNSNPEAQVTAGTIQINLTPDPNSDLPGLLTENVNVTADESAAQIAQGLATQITNQVKNFPVLNGTYTATTGTEVDREGGTNLTFQTVTITPVNGVGADFTKTGTSTPPGKTAPGNAYLMPKIVNAGPGTSSMQLLPVQPPNPSLSINWQLGVVNQNDQLLATSTLDEPDTTPAATLISMFATDLTSQDIPVVASGDTLNLTTDDNDFFVLTQSAGGSLYPLFSDASIPEPSSLTLLAIGAAGVFCYTWRRCRQRFTQPGSHRIGDRLPRPRDNTTRQVS